MKTIKSIALVCFALMLSSCDGGSGAGGGGGGGGGGGAPAASDPAPTPTPVPVVSASPELLSVPIDPNQISVISASPADVYLISNASTQLSLTLSDPLNKSKCTWSQEVPNQAGFPGGLAEATYGLVNGPCTPFTVTQSNSLDIIWRVYANNGVTTTSQKWTTHFLGGAVNHDVAVSAITPLGNVFVYDVKLFEVQVTDLDGNAACSWKVDNVQVSTGCLRYQYTQADAQDHAVLFTIDDGVHTARSVSWTAAPGAKLLSVSPATATVANGAAQTFTATVSDPHASSYRCEFKLDGALAQARGACSYPYTRSDNSSHTIAVDITYDAAGVSRNDQLIRVYAIKPANNSVSIGAGVFPTASTTRYLAKTATSENFGVPTWTDVDGDAWFEWYVNGVKVDCSTDPRCQYSNAGYQNGIRFVNYDSARMDVMVKLTDGQYSDTRSWVVQWDHSEINTKVPVGNKCYKSGTQLTMWGNGFEQTDTFSIQNQNVVLTKVQVTSTYVTLQLPADVTPGNQAIRVVKAAVPFTTAIGFVTFTNAAQYCQ